MTRTEKYQNEFVQFRNELRSFIYRMVNHRQETEDIAQDTYIRAFKNLSSFQERSSFKSWVFSIATNLIKDSFRASRKWGENWQDLGKEFNLENEQILQDKVSISRTSEQGKFVIREHISFCFTCITKTLPLTHQICLLLKEVYSFKVHEIMLITGLTEGRVKHAIADARRDMSRIFERRCSLINKKGICHQCTELNGIFNPEQDACIETNRIRMVKEAGRANYNELLKLRLQLIKSIDPLNSEGTNLHNYIMENCPDWAEHQISRQSRN